MLSDLQKVMSAISSTRKKNNSPSVRWSSFWRCSVASSIYRVNTIATCAVSADKCQPVFPIGFIPYANNLCRNRISFSHHDINRKQIFWFATAFSVSGIYLFDIQLFTAVGILDTAAFLDHGDHIHAFCLNCCDLCLVGKPGIKQDILSFQSWTEGCIQQSHHCFRCFRLSKFTSFSCKGSVIKVLYRTDDICIFCRCQQTAVYRDQCISITPA